MNQWDFELPVFNNSSPKSIADVYRRRYNPNCENAAACYTTALSFAYVGSTIDEEEAMYAEGPIGVRRITVSNEFEQYVLKHPH